jgi:hypothetical protein
VKDVAVNHARPSAFLSYCSGKKVAPGRTVLPKVLSTWALASHRRRKAMKTLPLPPHLAYYL